MCTEGVVDELLQQALFDDLVQSYQVDFQLSFPEATKEAIEEIHMRGLEFNPDARIEATSDGTSISSALVMISAAARESDFCKLKAAAQELQDIVSRGADINQTEVQVVLSIEIISAVRLLLDMPDKHDACCAILKVVAGWLVMALPRRSADTLTRKPQNSE